MPRKIQNTTKSDLISVALPNHAATYTVISHQFIIDYAHQALAAAGFGIVDEQYRCTADGQIATGVYKLQFNSDPDLSMMFAWTNSYNKQVKFKCVVGAYINKTGAVMISGDIGSWVRKHTGTADTETKKIIDDYITNAHMYYTQLCADKATMEGITLNKRKQSQLLGVLFAEYEILTTEQASMIRDQMKKPYHVFTNTDSLWSFYNYVTIALQNSHPKTWMEDQRILHYFIGTICDFSAPVQNVTAQIPLVPIVDPLYQDPEQTNILDQIAELETENDDTSDENDDTSIEVTDNQVVQEEVEIDTVLHQSEEIIEEVNEAEEVPFDIDEDDDSVLGSLLTPCVVQDVETQREIGQENSTDIFPQDEIVEYINPAADTFELVNPKTNEELVAEYNATHDDSHMNIEYLSPEEVKEKYGQEIVIHVESDEEYVQRVAEIEGEPEVETKMPQEIMDALMNATETDASEVDMSKVTWVDDSDTVQYTDPAGNTFEAPIVIEDLIIEEKPEEEITKDEFALEDNFDLDFSEDTDEDPDSIPDFF
jgi:hypothetical protein